MSTHCMFLPKSCLLVALVAMPWWVSAQDNPASQLHRSANASICANCHGTEGRTVKDSSVPSIAGLPKDYLVQQMQAFKNGTRPATIMHQISKGLTEEQITSMADYFAAQPR
ncbi:MAG: c-type cytochrome [Limnohabitans sp.]